MPDASNKSNILFLTSSINYPFYRKRLIAFYKLGLIFDVYGFDRRLEFPSTELPFSYIELSISKAKNYFLRFLGFVLVVPKLRRAFKAKEIKVVYVFGFDMALLAYIVRLFIFKKPKLVCEIHDIREVMVKNGLNGMLLRTLEKHIVNNLEMLVVTSEAYIDNYYKKRLGLTKLNWFLLENKLRKDELQIRSTKTHQRQKDFIVIGFFGSLRCQYAWNALKKIVEMGRGKIRVYVRGFPTGLESFERDIEEIEYIEYGGVYRDPEDLADVYSDVDIIWAAGFHEKSSFVWARSCRFYNAIAFGKAVIAQIGTEDCRFIEKYKIGTCIDLMDVNSSSKTILELNRKNIDHWKVNIKKLPESIYLYTTEHADLLRKLDLI